MDLLEIIDILVPYVAFISLGLNLFTITKNYLQGRMKLELTFPSNYSTCLTTDPSNPVQTHIFSLAIIVSNNSTNPIVINSISLYSDSKTYSSDFDSKHIGHAEANEISLEGGTVWYRNELRSTPLPIKLESKTQQLITFYFQTPISFKPIKSILKTNIKDIESEDINSFVLKLFDECDNR